ncbi:MAG TPA: hypothetical protein VJU82_17730 [Acidobacteriaceae bacterium]|nr:hypothetical protein [Acidobacteriaceae bacterium]
MLESQSSLFRFRAICSRASALALLAMITSIPAHAQGRMTPGKSIGSVTTHGNLIILTLNEDALGKPHLFDLAHHTVRFTPEGSRYRVETLPETWDNDFGAEMKDSHVTLAKLTFPFSGKSWSSFSVGVTGSITFGEAEAVPGRMRGGPPNRGGGLSVERYALLQRVGSTFINGTPAISAFFKPRMTGTRYLKELSDRAVVTWSLSEPYGGIQDWTWKPTVNRFQAVLHNDGVIELTYDEVSARDAIVGIFPKIDSHGEKPIATLMPKQQSASPAQLSLKDVTLVNVDGIYLQARIETAEPVAAQGDTPTAPIFRLCLSLSKPTEPCSDHLSGATVWTVQQARGFRGQRTGATGPGSRYFALGPGALPEVTVDKNAVSFKGVLPAGIRNGSEIYVSAGVEGTDGAEAVHLSAQPVRLQDLGSPELHLADMKKQDGAFPVVYESFYYPESPRPNDLTCSVIKALGDKFDLLAYYSDFRIDNPEAGTPSTGPLGGGPNGGAVTGIGATQRNLASYCTQGRFQWQFVQPVYVGANQMDEYPPDDVKDDNRHNVVAYTHQLAERTFNGKIPPYDYAMSQIGHEMGHRWSAFVSAKINGELIPLGPTHWATGLQAPAAFPYQRPVEASAMGGGVWQDNFDGTYTQLDDDYYVPATGWSYLDLYLMGLIAPSEVPDFFLLRNLTPQGKDANGHPIYQADRTKITINDVIAAEGPRLPDVDHAQKHFNTGMVIVLEHGHKPPPELLERVEGIRLRWMDYWQTTTGHRSDMTTNPR